MRGLGLAIHWSGAAYAQGPFEVCQHRDIVAKRQVSNASVERIDSLAMGRDHGISAAHAQGPFEFRLGRGILAGWQASSVGIERRDG